MMYMGLNRELADGMRCVCELLHIHKKLNTFAVHRVEVEVAALTFVPCEESVTSFVHSVFYFII